jgi:hypothetical protein
MSNQPHCVTVRLHEHHYAAAEEAASKLPIYKGSHRGLEANIVGCLGEIVFMEYLTQEGVAYQEAFETTHDITIVGSGRLDIKTKDRTVPPKPTYEASVTLYNHDHQDVHYWGFVSLQRGTAKPRYAESFHLAHIVGVANRAILDRFGKVWKEGETDPANGTKFWTGCINTNIGNLKPIREAVAIWKQRQTGTP